MMGSRSTILSLLVSLGLLAACVRPAELEEIGQEDILVVEGLITDEDKKQEVKISRTIPVTAGDTIIPEQNATVAIRESTQTLLPLIEEEPGIYRTENNFSAIPGMELQLVITLEDGNAYESTVVTMQSTPDIDSIYATFTPNPINNRDGGDFRFLLATQPTDDNAQAIRWTWRGAYEVQMETPSRYEWLGGNDVRIRELGGDNSELQVERCWVNQRSTDIIVGQESVTGFGIRDFQIHGFHSDTKFLRRQYGIEVTQYGLSADALTYWQLIAETNQGSGFLFDRQVGTVLGNIRNVDDPDEFVLGIFEAAELKTSFRRFDHAEFIDDGYIRFSEFFINCSGIQPLETATDEIGEFMQRNYPGWEIGFFITNGPVLYFPSRCSNCTRYGNNAPPEFWE